MRNFIKKLLGLNVHDEINELRDQLKKEREKNLKDMKLLNKKLRATINSGEIEITITNIGKVIE